MSNGFPAWWKHGQKVTTRSDGVLTLNIAPDAEYWLTNDEGKEVYVFSADIIGPVKSDTEGGSPMKALNKQALREAAIHAQSSDDWGYDDDNFHDKATPDAVLMLLDELEAAERQNGYLREQRDEWERKAISNFEECTEMSARIEELESQRKLAFTACNRWADKFSEAEKRIAELESNPIATLDVQSERADGNKFALVYSSAAHKLPDDVYYLCVAAAGIGVKGE
ncbi:ead/Ea22-like family protein [Citrobacter sp. Cy232]|uniref:hypothetical protein n=1 Tax=unclassified Citrobacter TaxID=2644389 RepID=UPI00190519A5|nr:MULTISPECIES: hypothetical protein [unclassified Citrobacter]MBJ9883206.1 hypothetical protein [Citrobacter sp. FDAARGOS_156]MDM2718705.1 ead/Ea22-like family protein [Citrobacter sp. Cy232]